MPPTPLRRILSSTITLAAVACALLSTSSTSAAESQPGPWDMEELSKAPAATWGEKQGLVQEVYFEGEPLKGKPTRVFAYVGRPAEGEGPFPGMVLVHGGGGRAFAEWARLWAERGYVAIAMDLAGCGPDGERLPDGGPGQGHDQKFAEFTDETFDKMWTYHAVAAAIRAHSLLRSLPEVDRERTGLTGISWGGYLTCIIAGVDRRFKVAVPVYGCGFLDHNSCWVPIFEKMEPEQRRRWVRYFDPSQYLPHVQCPILFVNGTNDFAYPLDSYQKSYRAVPGRADVRIEVRMPHGHKAGWAPQEIGLYVDSILRDGAPLPHLGELKIEGNVVSASFDATAPVVAGHLHFTTDTGNFKQRKWQSVEATIGDNQVRATLPEDRPLMYYLSVTDQRGAMTSTEHAELPEAK